MRELLDKICAGGHLSQSQTEDVFYSLLGGHIDPLMTSAFLCALRTKGEQIFEIAGAAFAVRNLALDFPRPKYEYADSCGTGGDLKGTINISTAVALVSATMGIKIVKHGNRSVSSKCGSADLLDHLGININAPAQVSRRCLDELGICFLFAPQYHAGMRHVMPVRRSLGIRTIFNLLGPLVNPSAPAYQLMGVYDPSLCVPVAQTLGLLGCKSAMVVHGGGLDEIAIHASTTAAILKDGVVTQTMISPQQAGLKSIPLKHLAGGGPSQNAKIISALLSGKGNEAHENAVSINAGALSMICGQSEDLLEGTALALDAIRSGAAYELLLKWEDLSNAGQNNQT